MGEPSELTDAVERQAALIGLSIDPAYRAAVAENLARLLAAAAVMMEFPLPDELGPASIFRP